MTVSKRITDASAERRARLIGRDDEVEWLEAVLFEADPIGISFEDNTDEYRAEAESILMRQQEARSKDDVRRIVHEVFVLWFDKKTAGPPERYERIAQTIWLRWDPSQGRALSQ
ncbi:MAG: hypothetical protein AAGD18_15255 [Actinomycetota bacterium]